MKSLDVAVVDASVVAELLIELDPQRSAEAAALFRRTTDAEPLELWAPDLLHLEVVSVLRKLVRRRALSVRAGGWAVERLGRLPIRYTGSANLLPGIWKLRDRLTPYDAAYLLVASELDAPLITTDARLRQAAPRGHDVRLLTDLSGSS